MAQFDTKSVLEEYRYVFIITYGRSGSTILMRFMNSDPLFQIRGENFSALTRLVQSIISIESTKRRYGVHEKYRNTDAAWFGASEIDENRFIDSLLNSFVRDVLKPSINTKVIGFKEIRYMPKHLTDEDFDVFCHFLISRFPKAILVFNKRAWWEVAQSGWFRHWWPLRVRSMVLQSDVRFQRVAARYPNRCIVFEHKELNKDSPRVRELLDFIGAKVSEEEVRRVLSCRLTHVKDRFRTNYAYAIICFPIRNFRRLLSSKMKIK